MKTALRFTEFIQASQDHVWNLMLGLGTYMLWSAAFCEGSLFEGSWTEGGKIRCLALSGDGVISEIAENRLHERLSIRHLGEVKAGVEDLTSERVRAWAPAYEIYSFATAQDGTELQVDVEIAPE